MESCLLTVRRIPGFQLQFPPDELAHVDREVRVRGDHLEGVPVPSETREPDAAEEDGQRHGRAARIKQTEGLLVFAVQVGHDHEEELGWETIEGTHVDE